MGWRRELLPCPVAEEVEIGDKYLIAHQCSREEETVLSARDHRRPTGKVDRVLVSAAGASVLAFAGVCIAYFWRVSR